MESTLLTGDEMRRVEPARLSTNTAEKELMIIGIRIRIIMLMIMMIMIIMIISLLL